MKQTLDQINNAAEMWCELFVAWLHANGATCKKVNSPQSCFEIFIDFVYCGRNYGFAIYSCANYCTNYVSPVVGRRLELDVSYGLKWLKINLNLTDVEIRNPSFDPTTFFEPIKRKLDKDLMSKTHGKQSTTNHVITTGQLTREA